MDSRLHFLRDTRIEAYQFECVGCGGTSSPAEDEWDAVDAAEAEGKFFPDGWYCRECTKERERQNARRWWCNRCGWQYDHFNDKQRRAATPKHSFVMPSAVLDGLERYAKPKEVYRCPKCGKVLDPEMESEAVEPPEVTKQRLERWIAFVNSQKLEVSHE